MEPSWKRSSDSWAQRRERTRRGKTLGLTHFGKCDVRPNYPARSQSELNRHGFVSVSIQTGVSNWQDANIVKSRRTPFFAFIPPAKRISSSANGKLRWKWR